MNKVTAEVRLLITNLCRGFCVAWKLEEEKYAGKECKIEKNKNKKQDLVVDLVLSSAMNVLNSQKFKLKK